MEKRLRLHLTSNPREKILKRSSNEIYLGHSTGGREMRRDIPISFFFLTWLSIQVLFNNAISLFGSNSYVYLQYIHTHLHTIFRIDITMCTCAIVMLKLFLLLDINVKIPESTKDPHLICLMSTDSDSSFVLGFDSGILLDLSGRK